jgi:alpha-L-rhamnosidase
MNSKRLARFDLWIFAALLSFPVLASAQSVDPRGPVAGFAGKVEVNKEGAALTGVDAKSPIRRLPSPDQSWQPKWITLSGADRPRAIAIRFRKEVELPSAVRMRSAVAWVTADCSYRLWINGVLVSRGPDDPGHDYSPHERWSHQWLANQVDVKAYLRPGVNVIAAEVFHEHREDYSLGTTALGFRLAIGGKPGSREFVVESGPDWKVQEVKAYTTGPIRLEQAPGEEGSDGLRYDATADEAGWRDADFREEGWVAAKVIRSIWGPVEISRLPPMMETVWPIAGIGKLRGMPLPDSEGRAEHVDGGMERPLVLSHDGAFEVDYDRVLSGYISLSIEGSPGTTVSVWPRELRTDAPGRRPFQITLGKGMTRFETPAMESFSALEIDVFHATGPVHFRDIRASFVSQPVAYRGSFTSSDEGLNALWKASRWQTQICLQNRFLDSPDHQEPIGDPGDYLIEAKVADYAFGPVAMTPQFLREFAGILDHWMEDHPTGPPNFHTSYSLLWLQTLLDYYDETGDAVLARELAPSAYRLLERYSQWIGANGILSEAPNYLFMDWVTIGGFQTHHPPAVIGQGYLTAFYYRGLADGIRLAKLTGNKAQVEGYTKQRVELRDAFNRELWDARAGLYRDGKPFLNHNPTSPDFLPPDRDIETHSPHVNALAVLYDLAPREEQAKILARILGSPGPVGGGNEAAGSQDLQGKLNVQPYFMHFVFAAEAHAGVLGLYAREQLARWVVNPQTQTFQEMWGRGDWSHGWGGTPLIQMSSHVLGVSPASPGYATVALAPHPLGLTFAKGTVPTPGGDVAVSWTRSAESFTYEVTLPAGAKGLLNLDGVGASGSVQVSVDGGRKVYKGPVVLDEGTHRVVLSWVQPE